MSNVNLQETAANAAPVLKILATGGCGIDIAKHFQNSVEGDEEGFAKIEISYIDTSRSNMPADARENQIYLLPGEVDGSGGMRSHNAAAIMRHAKEVLQKHRPGYLTVVVSSAGGGSGSVLAPVLVDQLIREGHMVVVLLVGDDSSGLRIKNTLNTLDTYENIAKGAERGLVVGYYENSKDIKQSEVDANVRTMINVLAMFFSRANHGLDTQDLRHFLSFEIPTDYPAHAAGLTVVPNVVTEEYAEGLVGVASLQVSKDDKVLDVATPNHCYGIMPEALRNDPTVKPLNLVVRAYPFNDIASRLRKSLDNLQREAAARTATSSLGSKPAGGGFLAL